LICNKHAGSFEAVSFEVSPGGGWRHGRFSWCLQAAAGFWSLTLHLGRLGQEGCLIGLEVINTFNSNVSSGRLDLGDQFLHKIRSGRKAAYRTGPAQSGPPFFSPSRLRQHKFSLLSVCVDTAKRPRSHGAHTAFLTCFAPRFHFETKKSIFQKGKR
jgi:hypothetical protein